ncbi:hypothetical protein [Lysobacter sp. H21R4]|uniref:tetratricopeptide repeat protein n=1 Tax=Lysobacter sp. H21R4 TaxID=2781021 RepID=UPI001E3C86AA|nr:hypothetical protein [Lysobacter sp. H21R4]
MSGEGPQGPFALSRAGALRTAFACCAAAILAVLAVQLARVDGSVGRPYGPDRLIESVDDHADPATGLPENAATSARKALTMRPIDGRAYRVLGQVAMATGDDAGAGKLLGIATERWPRDRMAQALLAQRALVDNDSVAAVTHLDALLRVAPDIRAPVFAQMLTLLEFPEFRAALIDRVGMDPPWRAALVRTLRAGDTPPGPALAMLDELATRHPLKDDELQARVALLARGGSPQVARAAWISSLDPAVRGAAKPVFDGGFEHPDISEGFAWQIRSMPGVVIGPDAGNPHSGNHSLAIAFSGRAVQFAHVRQPLALPAGTWRLRASADNRTGSTRPFVWQLTCEGSKDRVAELALPQSRGWQTVEGDFAINANCAGQQLLLRHTGRNLTERQMRGTLYVDDVEIVRVAGG